MKRLGFVVEGQSERAFVNSMLKPHLSNLSIPVVNLQGGAMSAKKIRARARDFAHNCDHSTTLVDLYKFEGADKKSAEQLQKEIAVGMPETFLPYIQKHEFEALLFSDINAVNAFFGDEGERGAALVEARAPEDINHKMPPSKLLKSHFQNYIKTTSGIEILRQIGLPKIRAKCPRFHNWLSQLEKWNTD